jgi:signal transduction histidine kinase
MANQETLGSLKKQHRETGHRKSIVFPFTVILISALGQLLFTQYVRNLPPLGQFGYIVCILIIVIVTALEIFGTRLSKSVKLFEYILLHALAFLAFLYVLPIGSAYTLYVMLIGILVYFDYGYRAMFISIGGIIGSMLLRFLFTKGIHDVYALSEYLVLCTSVVVMTVYATLILRISAKEIKAIEKANDLVASNEQQIQSLINNITDGVLAVDQNNRIVIYNAAALDVLDVNTAITNQKISSILKPVDKESQPIDIDLLLSNVTTNTNNRDLRLIYSDGSIANIFLGIAPIYLGYGKAKNNGYTLIMRDITREKSLEEERDEFISVVSHELRTPIAITEGSISNAQFIADKTGDIETIRKTLKDSHNQVIFLADMINDLSTLSRAERGKLEIDLAIINVAELVRELADNYGPQAEAKGLVVTTDVADDVGELQSSKLYVREILQNFITNAVKYTESGSVTIRARSNPKGIDFAVIDTGIGISKSDQNKVFDKFFRSEDFRTRANNGTGLGLYVTMKLVRLIHADIDVSSELNKGSTFSIFIPNLK